MSYHLDCRNYAPLDVAKGMCHVRKEIILADGKSCEMFEKKRDLRRSTSARCSA